MQMSLVYLVVQYERKNIVKIRTVADVAKLVLSHHMGHGSGGGDSGGNY